jgi:hypothetical protein
VPAGARTTHIFWKKRCLYLENLIGSRTAQG